MVGIPEGIPFRFIYGSFRIYMYKEIVNAAFARWGRSAISGKNQRKKVEK